MTSPLISDKVRYKVDHTKFYHVKAKWVAILQYQDTVFNYLDKVQCKNIVRLLWTNPFVEDIAVYDNEGNVKHFPPKYDQHYAEQILKQLWDFQEEVDEMKIKHRSNLTWQKILLERRTALKEAKARYPGKKCKLYKGKVMIQGVNCMLYGSKRADGAEFPPDCDDWWK